MESDWEGISVRAWNRPTVHDTPPQAAIDDSLVSWYVDKYAGVVDDPVRLMGDGQTGSGEADEKIEKCLWDFDNNWDIVELEQPANDIVSGTWKDASTGGKIYCKAVTNYGVESDEKLFSLTIYDTLDVNPGGP